MAAKDRAAARALSLGLALQHEPYNFDFFQAVRTLECIHRDKPRIGRSLRAADDPVRLGQEPSLAFAASSLASYRPAKNDRPPRLSGHFFGLLGPNGPLPRHLTEYAYDRAHNAHDPTFARFLDLFHHRMMTLFYRAWANARPAVSYDRPEADWFGVYLASLAGLGMDSLRRRDAMPDATKLHYVGHLSCQSRHPEGLQAMLRDFFGLPANIEEFVGAWMELPENGCCRLGETPETGTLGVNTIAGSRVWGYGQKFRVIMGAMSAADFERLLPGGESLRRLVALVRNYIGDELDWDLNLVLEKEQVPPLKLDGNSRLGWTTWLGTRQSESDADELILHPMSHAA